MNIEEIIHLIEKIKNIMVSVSTGGDRIQDVDKDYQIAYNRIDIELRNLSIKNPNFYSSLWEWYGGWSSGDLPTYQSRRQYLSEMFNPLLKELRNRISGIPPSILQEPTGWPRVDRAVGEIRKRLAVANNEEQYQAIGLLCRETLISLAQSVYDPIIHPNVDGVKPSETDAKRMLENYIASTLAGNTNEVLRQFAKSAYNLANDLQHKRIADFRLAALCVDATASVVNVVATISGRRDPK